METVFVVGLGMVGIAFIDKLLALDEARRYRIVTCGEEAYFAYNRVALTEYFQHRSIDELYLNKPDWYTSQDPDRLTFHLGEQVVRIDTGAKSVRTSKGRDIPYDICVLATGSDAALPSYLSPERAQSTQGVFVYRSVADLDRILAYAESDSIRGGTAAVVGGGLLGLEAAKALYDLPAIPNVTILNRSAHPLSRQLDADAGALVAARISALGVELRMRCSPVDITTRPAADVGGDAVFTGFALPDGTHVRAALAVFAIGIVPRDDLARASGIACAPAGGVAVGDDLATSAPGVFAIGECASWRGRCYGLVGPGVEMASILAFNLTQTAGFQPRAMNAPDLSTKLKLMGVDVASFGDYFADRRPSVLTNGHAKSLESATNGHVAPRKLHGQATSEAGGIQCLTYHDPFGGLYKKYIFTADGKYLLGGMMIGDTADHVKLVSIVKRRKALEVPPGEFILGQKKDGDGADELDDDAHVCSCHSVTKGAICAAVRGGTSDIGALKSQTKAGTGCGGCVPLLTTLFKAEMAKAGRATSNRLCAHFAHSRADLFAIIKVKQLRTFGAAMCAAGERADALGCEVCRPAVASILASLWNEHPLAPAHHANQDTNDRFLANMQRDGTFSVVPRVPGGEITPQKLVVLGTVAQKYGLYTKITGGQRIDLFGAHKGDLPDIWEELVHAGFESGHAYGKALRTVKSCVGTTWCRYGVGDSVGLQLEQRYKGIRAPHKFKGGVSGCVRECAEAQAKDFGLIATDKGWNIFVGGNGGANPRHATLLAADVPPTQVVKLLDRFIMFYIRTADKLTRTARWIEQFDGGIEKLKKILLQDELGICGDLEREMEALVGTYQCEWKGVVEDPERRKQFKQFVNADDKQLPHEKIVERGQKRPADWPKEHPPVKFTHDLISTPKEEWQWRTMAKVEDLKPSSPGATSAAVKYGDTPLALYHVPQRGYFATQQMCPHRRAFVLEHGIVGDAPGTADVHVSCPLHKRNFRLTDGACISDDRYSILAFEARTEGSDVLVRLPDAAALDAVAGAQKWMTRGETARELGEGHAVSIDPQLARPHTTKSTSGCNGTAICGNPALDW